MTEDYTLQQKQALAMAAARKRQAEASDIPEQKTSIAGDLGQDLIKRESEIQRFNQMQQQGKISPVFKGYLAAGEAAGAGLDVVSAGLKSADYMLGGVPSSMAKGAASMVGSIPLPNGNTVGGVASQAAQKIGQGYNYAKQEAPLLMEGLEATGNLASVLSPVSGTKSVGKVLSESGEKKASSWIDDLVTPLYDDKNIITRAEKDLLDEGIISKRKILPTDLEKEASEIIKNMKGINRLNPLTKNYYQIKKEAVKRAQDLSSDLGKFNNFKLKPQVIDQGIYSKIRRNLEENPFLVKSNAVDLKETQENFISVLQKSIESEPPTLQGLLTARRKFDQFVESQRPSALQPEALGAYSQTVKTVRSSVNDFLEQAVPDESVKKRLRESHALYEAAGNIRDKIPKSANGVIEKIAQKIPGKNALTKTAVATAGLGAAGTGVALAPIATGIAATAGGLYLGGKLVTSGTARKYLGELMKAPGVNKADVAALQDYMEYLTQQEDETLNQPVNNGINNKQEVR